MLGVWNRPHEATPVNSSAIICGSKNRTKVLKSSRSPRRSINLRKPIHHTRPFIDIRPPSCLPVSIFHTSSLSTQAAVFTSSRLTAHSTPTASDDPLLQTEKQPLASRISFFHIHRIAILIRFLIQTDSHTLQFRPTSNIPPRLNIKTTQPAATSHILHTMSSTPPTVNDKTLDSVQFITAKPLLQRLDIFPFIILYSALLGLYFNIEPIAENEWVQIILMITILLSVVAHVVVLLLGYWRVTFRIKLAYTIHSPSSIISAFKTFNQSTFTDGIRYVQDEYESQLTRYKMWYTLYQKKLEAQKAYHDKLVQAYNRHPSPENAIPPGPFVPPEPPKSPQLGNPVVIFEGQLLEICVKPKKHHGNPIITRCIYDVADKTRAQYHINGIVTIDDIINGDVYNKQSTILISGPQLYPPLKFAFHHTNYLLDPNSTESTPHEVENDISAVFQRLQYPDNDKLVNYLSHKHTAGISKPSQHPQSRSIPNSSTLSTSSGRSSTFKLLQYGLNSLTVPIPSFLTIFIENAMSPFFVFQIICILLWCLDEYWYYSLFTLFMIVALECTVVYKRQSHLSQMLGEKPPLPHVYVYRQQDSTLPPITTSRNKQTTSKTTIPLKTVNNTPGEWELISTKQLVPGDVIALSVYNDRSQIQKVYGSLLPETALVSEPASSSSSSSSSSAAQPNDAEYAFKSGKPTLFTTDIPCDLLLLSGSCVCDESMLTGESVPQVKEDLLSLQTAKDHNNSLTTDSPLPPGSPHYNPVTGSVDDELVVNLDQKIHKRYMLYAGTKLIGVQRNYQHSFFMSTSIITPQVTHKSTTIDDIDGDDDNDHDDDDDDLEAELEEASVLSDKKRNFLTLSNKPPVPLGTDVVLCRVLRTGFTTTQGSLVRTILTATDQVLVDREALYFILGLLAVAMISAYFVLIEGLADRTRSRYKLLLNVITILTSVVPPELPMQLSMAVNNALASLAKTQVFCTEPNRLPHAGQVDVCCFDKTGTLTSDSFLLTCAVTHQNQNDINTDSMDRFLILQKETGDDQCVSGEGCDKDDSMKSVDLRNLPIDMRLILGSSHELAMLQLPPKQLTQEEIQQGKKSSPRQKIVGDPMESVAFEQSGFHFLPRTQQSGQSVDTNVNNKVFCDATLTYLNTTSNQYQPVPSSITSAQNAGTNPKLRLDVEIVHRFAFQSQLQRMSTIVQVSPPTSKSSANSDFNAVCEKNPEFHWLNTTLPLTPATRQLGSTKNTELPTIRSLAQQTYLRCVVKGSPEMIYTLLHPDHRPDYEMYTKIHKQLARQGLRVLALAWKPLFIDQNGLLCDLPGVSTSLNALGQDQSKIKGSIGYQHEFFRKHPKATQNVLVSSLKVPTRDYCEQGLFFAGIIGFNSPLKTQSFEVIQHLQQSFHKTIMITGDHLLTAIAVAKQLDIAKSNCLLLAKSYFDTTLNKQVDKLVWLNEHEGYVKDFSPTDQMYDEIQSKSVVDQTVSLCINGDSLAVVTEHHPHCLPILTSSTSVFARTLPDQKELILKHLKEHNGGQFTLMCGDGTNDVGALTHANIGIALSSIDTDSKEQLSLQETKLKEMNKNPIIKRQLETAQKLREKGFIPQAENMEKQAHDNFKRFKQSQLGRLMDSMGDDGGDEEADGSVKLGDASLAASFSAKHGSIRCVLDVIRQGRCALATTGQMYQILALQCLIAAYSLSALYFKGVRQSESQMTISGMVGAVMSMLLSNAQPLEKVSPRRPNSKIFSPYNITTIGLQFAIHLSILIYMVNYAMEFTDIESLKQGQDETITKYVPSVLNTVVFLLSTAMSATTILSNYVGFPFMTPLTWTPLFKLILATLVACCMLSLEQMPELNEMLEMSPMPNSHFSLTLTHFIVIDCIGCVVVGLATKLFFGILTWDDLTKPIPKNVISHSITKATPSKATTTTTTTTTTSTTTTTTTTTTPPALTNSKASKRKAD